MSRGERWALSPDRSSSWRGRTTGGPIFGPMCKSEGRSRRRRRVHHISPKGAALATSTVIDDATPRRRGRRVSASPGAVPGTTAGRGVPEGPTKQTGPGGWTGASRTLEVLWTPIADGRPAVASVGTEVTRSRVRTRTNAGPIMPRRRVPATTSPSAWTHPAPLLWATTPQPRTTRRALARGTRGRTGRTKVRERDRTRTRSRPDRWGHGRGAGVDSSSPRTTATPRSTPSSVMSRWARQAVATAFTSSGVT